jgi:hypothetical protein
LEDGNYLFRSYSEQSWSFCGVFGAGYRELSFQISDCVCHAEVDREAQERTGKQHAGNSKGRRKSLKDVKQR